MSDDFADDPGLLDENDEGVTGGGGDGDNNAIGEDDPVRTRDRDKLTIAKRTFLNFSFISGS